jgi:hypothetical protein
MTGPAGKKAPGATLAGATGREDYGATYKFLRCIQRLSDAVRRMSESVSFWIEQQCARIETAHELAKWNRNLEENP